MSIAGRGEEVASHSTEWKPVHESERCEEWKRITSIEVLMCVFVCVSFFTYIVCLCVLFFCVFFFCFVCLFVYVFLHVAIHRNRLHYLFVFLIPSMVCVCVCVWVCGCIHFSHCTTIFITLNHQSIHHQFQHDRRERGSREEGKEGMRMYFLVTPRQVCSMET